MGRIAIVTDSAAAITPEELKERQKRGGFAVVPMPVAIQEATVRAGIRGPNRDEHPRCDWPGPRRDGRSHPHGACSGEHGQYLRPAPGVFADIYDALVDEGTSIFYRYTFQESSLEPLKPLG